MTDWTEIGILMAVIKGYSNNYRSGDIKNTMWPNTYMKGALTITFWELKGDLVINITLNGYE